MKEYRVHISVAPDRQHVVVEQDDGDFMPLKFTALEAYGWSLKVLDEIERAGGGDTINLAPPGVSPGYVPTAFLKAIAREVAARAGEIIDETELAGF